ncbi:tetratricopeptide repeat protein [Crocosphaera sp.]|uniref:tetratricopeptide repeat protein n=1 Tax=Crocosphaera sp. TaxID=2729996 RepID=UPI003F205DD0|nr:tetratricopeptide repeat protein [Crocosphaera sp.]
MNSAVMAEDSFSDGHTLPWNVANQKNTLIKKSSLDQNLEMINQIDNIQLKVNLLNDLALSYYKIGEIEQAKKILYQSLSLVESLNEQELKITTLIKIADYYYKIGQEKQALTVLDKVMPLVDTLEDKLIQGQLLLNAAFQYEKMQQEKKAELFLSQSQTLTAEAAQPSPDFPFKETPTQLKLGVAGNVSSFRDTTGFLGVNVDYNKQWTQEDILVDGNIYLGYDSSRAVNNYRPGALMTAVYRRHFDEDWNFFVDFFSSVNEDLYSSRNDDEDLTIVTGVWFGAGLNLWRGESNREFLDFQLGIGPRYEYDYVDFEERRNETSPTLGVIFLGRGFSLGKAKINQTFAFLPALDELEDFIFNSNTKLSYPITERWSFVSRLFLRYRSDKVLEENPDLNMFFSTGLEYSF